MMGALPGMAFKFSVMDGDCQPASFPESHAGMSPEDGAIPFMLVPRF